MKKYKIWTGSDRDKVLQTLDALFKRGYVFLNRERIRSIKEVTSQWWGFVGWDWIIIGSDSECKAVITVSSTGYSYDCDNEYQRITLDKFLKLK